MLGLLILTSRPASPWGPVIPGIPMFPDAPRAPAGPAGPSLPGAPCRVWRNSLVKHQSNGAGGSILKRGFFVSIKTFTLSHSADK